MTGRQAAEQLGALGLDRESARKALLAGVAGPATRAGTTVLYDADRVGELASGEHRRIDRLEVEELPEACRRGMVVVRLTPRRPDPGPERAWQGADLLAPREEQLDAARMWFRMSPWTRVLIRHRAGTGGGAGVPFVATVGTLVVLGADITGVDAGYPRGAALRLAEPGEWFETWRGARFEEGRAAGRSGGRQWCEAVVGGRRRPPP